MFYYCKDGEIERCASGPMATDTMNVHAILNARRFPAPRPKALAIAKAFRRIRGRGRRECPSESWVAEQRG
jgi:hypothetical protein